MVEVIDRWFRFQYWGKRWTSPNTRSMNMVASEISARLIRNDRCVLKLRLRHNNRSLLNPRSRSNLKPAIISIWSGFTDETYKSKSRSLETFSRCNPPLGVDETQRSLRNVKLPLFNSNFFKTRSIDLAYTFSLIIIFIVKQ